MYVCMYAKWYYFCRKVSVNARKWKNGWDIFFLASYVSHPNLLHLLFSLATPKVNLPHLSFAASEVQQLIFLFLCSSFFFPSYTATSLPSYLTENSSFFKEEIKQLALRFHLQSMWVSKLNLIWFCIFR